MGVNENLEEADLINGLNKGNDYISGLTAQMQQNTDSKHPNINIINVDNLFYDNYDIKLSYDDYCNITQDYDTLKYSKLDMLTP